MLMSFCMTTVMPNAILSRSAGEKDESCNISLYKMCLQAYPYKIVSNVRHAKKTGI